jgi:hypothetical protein
MVSPLSSEGSRPPAIIAAIGLSVTSFIRCSACKRICFDEFSRKCPVRLAYLDPVKIKFSYHLYSQE